MQDEAVDNVDYRFSNINIQGFKDYQSTSNIRTLSEFSLNENLNMKWESANRVVCRGGSWKFKNSDQWAGAKVIRFIDFAKRDDAFFYVIAALNNGKLFYIRSDNGSYGSPTATWTEILTPASASPALSASVLVRDFQGFNDKFFVCDGTNALWYVDFALNKLVSVSVPDLSTANVVSLSEKSYRLVALDDAGKTHLSDINDGATFTTGNVLNYGRIEGLKATSAIPFNDDLIITTENQQLGKYQTYRLLGIQFPQYDVGGVLIPGTEYEQFEVRKINSIAGIIGDSSQEIADNAIGLTPRGFIFLGGAVDSKDRVEEDTFASRPIRDLIRKINFNRPDLITSALDSINGRYLCAVPGNKISTSANTVLVYDFDRSSPKEGLYRWALWTFNWADSNIEHIGSIKGEPYASDSSGNIYRIDDNDYYADDGNPINHYVRTGSVGGQDLSSEKEYGVLQALFTDLSSDDIQMSVNPVIDGIRKITDISDQFYVAVDIARPIGNNFYDIGLRYDSGVYYDGGGTDQKIVTVTNRGGRGQVIQYEFSTNATGVRWGLGGFNVRMEKVEELNNSGNNLGNF
jgi:hypothetical protein